MRTIFVLFLFVSNFAYADLEYAGETIQISKDYYSGPNLIYDCKNKSYICVDNDNVLDCENRRDKANKLFQSNLNCAVIKHFETAKLCENFQQKKVNNPEGKTYCLHRQTRSGATH